MSAAKLYWAAFDGRLEKVRALIARGVTVDYRTRREGETPLMAAAQCGHLEVVKALLAAGADIDVADDAGDTALDKARAAKITDCASAIADERARRALSASIAQIHCDETAQLDAEVSDLVEQSQSLLGDAEAVSVDNAVPLLFKSTALRFGALQEQALAIVLDVRSDDMMRQLLRQQLQVNAAQAEAIRVLQSRVDQLEGLMVNAQARISSLEGSQSRPQQRPHQGQPPLQQQQKQQQQQVSFASKSVPLKHVDASSSLLHNEDEDAWLADLARKGRQVDTDAQREAQHSTASASLWDDDDDGNDGGDARDGIGGGKSDDDGDDDRITLTTTTTATTRDTLSTGTDAWFDDVEHLVAESNRTSGTLLWTNDDVDGDDTTTTRLKASHDAMDPDDGNAVLVSHDTPSCVGSDVDRGNDCDRVEDDGDVLTTASSSEGVADVTVDEANVVDGHPNHHHEPLEDDDGGQGVDSARTSSESLTELDNEHDDVDVTVGVGNDDDDDDVDDDDDDDAEDVHSEDVEDTHSVNDEFANGVDKFAMAYFEYTVGNSDGSTSDGEDSNDVHARVSAFDYVMCVSDLSTMDEDDVVAELVAHDDDDDDQASRVQRFAYVVGNSEDTTETEQVEDGEVE